MCMGPGNAVRLCTPGAGRGASDRALTRPSQSPSPPRSYFRCYVVHGTDDSVVQNNVAFDAYGHCYYLEDGVEEYNTIDGNLAALIRVMGTVRWSWGGRGLGRGWSPAPKPGTVPWDLSGAAGVAGQLPSWPCRDWMHRGRHAVPPGLLPTTSSPLLSRAACGWGGPERRHRQRHGHGPGESLGHCGCGVLHHQPQQLGHQQRRLGRLFRLLLPHPPQPHQHAQGRRLFALRAPDAVLHQQLGPLVW